MTHRFSALLSLVAALATVSLAPAADRTWIGGNVDWVDAGLATNWNPNDEPDADDTAIFNTANTVNLGSNNAVIGLTLSGGIDVLTNDFDLAVDGLAQLTGAGTNLVIGGAAGSINADDVTINGGTLELAAGTLTLDEESGTSFLDINAGGTLLGNGVISFADTPLAFTTVLSNDGTITALSRPLIIFGDPPAGTLQINTANAFELLDLDGSGDAGVVNVNRNQTLDVNGTLADAFGGTMTLAHQSTLDVSTAWGMNAGTLTANNGFVAGGLGVPDVPAGTSFISGGALTQTGGTINVADTDGTLQMNADFSASGGTISVAGTLIFNGVANITSAPALQLSGGTSNIVVNANTTINDAAGNFNWDGSGTADTTVNGVAELSITANLIDTGDNVFGGTITLNNGGDLTVNNTANIWTMGGTLDKIGPSVSTVSGEAVTVTGAINAGGTGTLDMPTTTLTSSANVTVTSRLTLGGASVLAGPAVVNGAGELEFEGTSTVSANTTVNVATFDWDGIGTGTAHTINDGVVFTINSATLDNDGDMDDPINLGGSNAQLIVNGPAQWTAVAAINANNAAAGTATIGGTSRLILSGASADLNVNGNTTISAPLTLDAGSFVDIDSLMLLDATGAVTYSGGVIDGLGTYSPGTTNVVTADSTINPDGFDFDGGTWVVESGAELTFNVVDYDNTVTNVFDSTITLVNGAVFANSADPEFIMDGILNMFASGGFDAAEWSGDAIDIGNDVGLLDAKLNVTGDGNPNSQGRFFAAVDFNSDADVSVPAGAFLNMIGVVNFDTVNAANNAEFTGAGTMAFNNVVNVNEAVTFNMVGGAIDLDGNDASGEFINIDAPMTINAATMANFGRVNGGGGVNTLDVNNSAGTGVLTVNLDSPAAEWTLNGPGVMNLVNDNTDATLLAGSAVNVDGTVNVTGDVRTTARLDVAGVVNINTVGQPLRLAGGDSFTSPNTIAGGSINGPGILGADADKRLNGHGTIAASIDFDGTADLFADGGTLTVSGAIVDVDAIGTLDADGILNVTNPWNSGVAAVVFNGGGTISGGVITNDSPFGMSGHGTVTARVVNNTNLRADTPGQTHVFQTALNDNDWDGAGGGALRAVGIGGTLELRDVGAAFPFTGTVQVGVDARVFTNGFALDFNPGSTINLIDGAYESTNSTDIGGAVTIGGTSTLKVANNSFLTFESGSTTTLNGNLRVENNNIILESGATFSGPGALIIPDGSHWVGENGANINVLAANEGGFRPGNSEGIGAVTIKDFQQTNTGELFVELAGTLLNQFDRLAVTGVAQLDGFLSIDIDGVFVPALGNTFNIITAPSVLGQFDYYDVSGMPAGLAFKVNYLANAVQLQVVNKPIFSADFDDDGDVDPTDLAIWRGAFNLNQLGDADGDNDSDGADFLMWQQQLGSKPTAVAATAAVPEPAATPLLIMTAAAWFARRRPRCSPTAC